MTEPLDTHEHLHGLVAALRRYDARIKGLACLADVATTGVEGAAQVDARHRPGVSHWHWHREVMLPASLGKLSAPLFDDPAVRLALADPPLMIAGLVARALYARRSAVRRCIDRTVLSQLRVALGDGRVGQERLLRLQRLSVVEGDSPLPIPPLLTPANLAHDGLARLRRAHPKLVPVVVHFVLMQLEGTPLPVHDIGDNAKGQAHDNADDNADDNDNANDDHNAEGSNSKPHASTERGRGLASDADRRFEAASFFESLPYLIPELV